jgi:hypothetical protein
MSVGELMAREERPALVRFERRPMEDKKASTEQGKYVAKDVDIAIVTPPYSKDQLEFEVNSWLKTIDRDARNERIPVRWAELWKESYFRWKNGQAMPLNGTAIKGWGLISPAQQEMLIHINILTVEDLAGANAEGLGRIGMGALDLKNKAINWLKSLNDSGKLAVQMTVLETENKILKESLETQAKQIKELMAHLNDQPKPSQTLVNEINIEDILSEEEPIKRGPGRPPKAKE